MDETPIIYYYFFMFSNMNGALIRSKPLDEGLDVLILTIEMSLKVKCLNYSFGLKDSKSTQYH